MSNEHRSLMPEFDHNKLVRTYKEVNHVLMPEKGYIVWRLGTGDNCELLHIRTVKKGQGNGRKLFYAMLDELKLNPPYYSVFGFTRSSNAESQAFYGALGFDLQTVLGVYKDGQAVLFYQSFKRLLKKRVKYEDCIRRKT